MTENLKEKIWTDCGYFETHELAKEKIAQLGEKFELYKIKKVREKSKEGWYKVKAWIQPVEKKNKKKKKK